MYILTQFLTDRKHG